MKGLTDELRDAFIMDTEITVLGEKIMAYFFFIPDAKSLKKIVNAILKFRSKFTWII